MFCKKIVSSSLSSHFTFNSHNFQKENTTPKLGDEFSRVFVPSLHLVYTEESTLPSRFLKYFSLSAGIRSEIMCGFERREMFNLIPRRRFSKPAARWDHTIRILIPGLIFKAHFSWAQCIQLKLQKTKIERWSHWNEKKSLHKSDFHSKK